MSTATDTFEAAFADVTWPHDQQAWRDAALELLRREGLPTRKNESWKYTDLSALAETPWTAATVAEADTPELAAIDGVDRVVFINGVFDITRSSIGELPAGVTLDAEHVPAFSGTPKHAIAGLNIALARQGLQLHVPDGVTLPRPIEVVNLTGERNHETMHHVRHTVRLGAGASATVFEQCLSGGADALSTQSWDLHVGDNAGLDFARLQNLGAEHRALDNLLAVVSRDARLSATLLELGGRMGRLDAIIRLDAPGASVDLRSLLFASGRAHLDHQLRLDHAAPNTASRMLGRAMAADRGRVVLDGLVHVLAGSAGTDSDQQLASLLLTPGAEANVKPELEIYADDVKASHGSTIGQLDNDAEFYLRSRGIDRVAARALLIRSFLAPALAGLPDALVPAAHAVLDSRLPGAGWLDGALETAA